MLGIHMFLFKITHRKVSYGGCSSRTHGHPLNLQEVFAIEVKIIASQDKREHAYNIIVLQGLNCVVPIFVQSEFGCTEGFNTRDVCI